MDSKIAFTHSKAVRNLWDMLVCQLRFPHIRLVVKFSLSWARWHFSLLNFRLLLYLIARNLLRSSMIFDSSGTFSSSQNVQPTVISLGHLVSHCSSSWEAFLQTKNGDSRKQRVPFKTSSTLTTSLTAASILAPQNGKRIRGTQPSSRWIVDRSSYLATATDWLTQILLFWKVRTAE